ncbi:hypothetical protein [Mycoplasmopsis cynos]|uniref:hypothetical protein n=1 Tax=Mycoplasmopsis cynos TaxID=171284 RepID=UPI00220F77C5|nr:hypothetical protein [Mycoplasmopsis cynos]UWV77162.1 hypothetical protein NW070_05390 [Mycoplasmopsis cynos]UWV81184.1 hypothetical protein NW065_04325 [Mycoplasmopsis cynos]UWV81582.1 hypothetical protein NW065_00055 [Mycoplasmopsis cynos]
MEILFNLNKQKKLTNFEKNRERSFILIAENINENARTLSIKTGLCVSSIKRYKKIIRSREKFKFLIKINLQKKHHI